MLCFVMWNLFTVGSLQFPNDSAIASVEANVSLFINILASKKILKKMVLYVTYRAFINLLHHTPKVVCYRLFNA